MAKVQCIATCYMPVKRGIKMPVERYEDEEGEDLTDLYDIPDNRLNEFLDTGNFLNVVWNESIRGLEALPREG